MIILLIFFPCCFKSFLCVLSSKRSSWNLGVDVKITVMSSTAAALGFALLDVSILKLFEDYTNRLHKQTTQKVWQA